MSKSLKKYFDEPFLESKFRLHISNKTERTNSAQILEENICDLVALLKTNNISSFLVFGTLLGAVREGRTIEYDHDADIGLLQSDVEKLVSIMNFLEVHGFDLLRVDNDYLSVSRHGEYIDLHVFRSTDAKDGNYCSSGYRLPVKHLLPIVWIDAMGGNVPVPNQAVDLLKFWYGNSWKIPIRGHHAIQNPNFLKSLRQWVRNKSLDQSGYPSGFLYKIYQLFQSFSSWVCSKRKM